MKIVFILVQRKVQKLEDCHRSIVFTIYGLIQENIDMESFAIFLKRNTEKTSLSMETLTNAHFHHIVISHQKFKI